MATWTEQDLRQQFAFLSENGWIGAIKDAAASISVAPEILFGIGSRETEFNPKYLRGPGDHGHGYGPFQIDIGSYPGWIYTGSWKDMPKSAAKAVEVLAEKRTEVSNLAAKRGVILTPEALLQVSIAAYNCGSTPAFDAYVQHGDPDRPTTGRDYSVSVLSRSQVFAKLLSGPPASPMAARPVLKIGAKGNDVMALQAALVLLDYLREAEIDGEFGPHVQAAVELFQEKEGLQVDGICGPATWAAINSALAAEG